MKKEFYIPGADSGFPLFNFITGNLPVKTRTFHKDIDGTSFEPTSYAIMSGNLPVKSKELMPLQENDLMPGWVQLFDQITGTKYWWNELFKTRREGRPGPLDDGHVGRNSGESDSLKLQLAFAKRRRTRLAAKLLMGSTPQVPVQPTLTLPPPPVSAPTVPASDLPLPPSVEAMPVPPILSTLPSPPPPPAAIVREDLVAEIISLARSLGLSSAFINAGAENLNAFDESSVEDDSLVYPSMEGVLSKESVGLFGSTAWQDRYFVLSKGILSYYESKLAFENKEDPRKNMMLPMVHFQIKPDAENPAAFFILPKELLQTSESSSRETNTHSSSAGSEVAVKDVYKGGNVSLHLNASSQKQRLRWMRALRGRRADGRHRKDSADFV
jgi:hypothetical protein